VEAARIRHRQIHWKKKLHSPGTVRSYYCTHKRKIGVIKKTHSGRKLLYLRNKRDYKNWAHRAHFQKSLDDTGVCPSSMPRHRQIFAMFFRVLASHKAPPRVGWSSWIKSLKEFDLDNYSWEAICILVLSSNASDSVIRGLWEKFTDEYSSPLSIVSAVRKSPSSIFNLLSNQHFRVPYNNKKTDAIIRISLIMSLAKEHSNGTQAAMRRAEIRTRKPAKAPNCRFDCDCCCI